jgi:hypothetical protein
MHEPLFNGISLPLIRCCPWSLRQTPLLVELERRLRKVLKAGEGDGRDILCKLLRILGRVGAMSDDMARQLLQVPGKKEVSSEDASGLGRESMVQAETKGG